MQRDVHRVLTGDQLGFSVVFREYPLTACDRIDFLVVDEVQHCRVGIECKIGGSLSAVTRQLFRYAKTAAVHALILVTAKTQLAAVPETINGKPVRVVVTLGAFL